MQKIFLDDSKLIRRRDWDEVQEDFADCRRKDGVCDEKDETFEKICEFGERKVIWKVLTINK
jgi:hypothetical protein